MKAAVDKLAEIKKDVFQVQCGAIDSSSLPPNICDDILVSLREAYYHLTLAEELLKSFSELDSI